MPATIATSAGCRCLAGGLARRAVRRVNAVKVRHSLNNRSRLASVKPTPYVDRGMATVITVTGDSHEPSLRVRVARHAMFFAWSVSAGQGQLRQEISLDGVWDFATDPDNRGETEQLAAARRQAARDAAARLCADGQRQDSRARHLGQPGLRHRNRADASFVHRQGLVQAAGRDSPAVGGTPGLPGDYRGLPLCQGLDQRPVPGRTPRATFRPSSTTSANRPGRARR